MKQNRLSTGDHESRKRCSLEHLPRLVGAVACLFLLLLITNLATAQDDPLFSQYMFNKMAYNPAYAGSRDGLSIDALYRTQWTKIDNAPTNMLLTAHDVSNNDKYGFGGQISRDVVGPISQYGFYGAYAYRFHFGGNILALGLQGGISYYSTNWAQLTAYQQGDPAYPGTQKNLIVPNFGAGIYFESKNISASFSVPHFINNDIENKAQVFIDNNYYLELDYKIRINDKFMIVPASLLKFTGDEAQLNVNVYFVFIKSIWLGGGYRSDNSANFTFQYEFRKDRQGFRIGYAYDLGNEAYRVPAGGSHEVMLTYEFAKRAPLRPPLSIMH